MIIPVILSGGSGTRLWPLSTPERPKQFLPLTGAESLFRQTVNRVRDPGVYAPPIVVANAAHEQLCLEELADIPGAQLILEPVARNTAVAIVMAAAVAAERAPDTLILVMPSDHRIGDVAAFHEAVSRGAVAARDDKMVTFGIKPTGPETGYGYLEAGEALANADGIQTVVRFTEKPDIESARDMVAGGRHYWNGGIFLFGASVLLAAARGLASEVHSSGIQAVASGSQQDGVIRPSREQLDACPDISIDYAIMERAEGVVTVPLDADWSDVGSWDVLAELPVPGNETSAVVSLDASNCYARSDGIEVALLGVEDLIVVASGNRVVVMRKGSSQQIKRLAALAAAR